MVYNHMVKRSKEAAPVRELFRSALAQECLRLTQRHHRDLVREIITITQIPAPTAQEEQRAQYLQRRFAEIGLTDVGIDSAGNCVGTFAGTGPRPRVLVCAHLDTVFPINTDCTVVQDGEMLRGPGVGDNAAGLGALIWAAEVLRRAGARPQGPILFAGTVGEEGLGNLKGIRALMDTYGHDLDCVIALDGSLGGLVRQGVGSRRLLLRVETEGGHSWGAFGSPSAIHSLARMIARICELRVPLDPKTTYNVGTITGGTSVNTIAPRAEAVLDLRSVDPGELSRLESRVGQIVHQVAEEAGVRVQTEIIGDRPAGAIGEKHPLCMAVREVHRHLDIQTRIYPSSTDGNVPLHLGIPTVTVGVTHGGNGHRVDEYIYTGPLIKGLGQVTLLLLAVQAVEMKG